MEINDSIFLLMTSATISSSTSSLIISTSGELFLPSKTSQASVVNSANVLATLNLVPGVIGFNFLLAFQFILIFSKNRNFISRCKCHNSFLVSWLYTFNIPALVLRTFALPGTINVFTARTLTL